MKQEYKIGDLVDRTQVILLTNGFLDESNAIEQMQKEHEQLKKFKEWIDEVAEEILGTNNDDMRECLSDMFFHRIVG